MDLASMEQVGGYRNGKRGELCDVMGCNSLHGLSWGRAQALFGDITA